MNENNKKLNELLETINNVELLSTDDLKEMDFYQLAYYMQTLNLLDSINEEEKKETLWN